MRLIFQQVILVLVPIVCWAQDPFEFERCPYRPSTLTVVPPEVQVVFGDTAAVDAMSIDSSGYVILTPQEAVGDFIDAVNGAGNALYTIHQCLWDDYSGGGALVTKIDLNEPVSTNWSIAYTKRTGLRLFWPEKMVVHANVVSVIGYFPMFDEGEREPNFFERVTGRANCYIGRLRIDPADGSLLGTDILADSLIVNAPGTASHLEVVSDTVYFYEQSLTDDAIILTRKTMKWNSEAVLYDTLYQNPQNNNRLEDKVRNSAVINCIETSEESVFYIDFLRNPEDTSYADLIKINRNGEITGKVTIDGDPATINNILLYQANDQFIQLTVVRSDNKSYPIFTTSLNLLGRLDDLSGFQNDHSLTMRRGYWPISIDSSLIIVGSDVGSGFENSEFSWYVLDEDCKVSSFIEDLVEPHFFEIRAVGLTYLPNNKIGLILETQCTDIGAFTGRHHQLWIVSEEVLKSYLKPSHTNDLNLNSRSLFVYPNPTSGRITIENHKEGHHHIIFTDGSIRMVQLSEDSTLDLSDFPTGIYTLREPKNGRAARFIKVD